MTQKEASDLIIEMLQVASKRGAYSSIELKAIQEAIEVLQGTVN